MYIQVTSCCNMACAHCLYSCGLKKGQHMSMDTFQQAVSVADSYDSPITIGGGEPTLHPDLLAMLGIVSLTSSMPPFMVTNGTCSKKVWNFLMSAQERKNIDVRVSKDLWHDTSMIRDWVWEDADRHRLLFLHAILFFLNVRKTPRVLIDHLCLECQSVTHTPLMTTLQKCTEILQDVQPQFHPSTSMYRRIRDILADAEKVMKK